MSGRGCAVLILVLTASAMAAPAAAQTGAELPRLADGRPDLQGVWDFRTLTPLERPEERAGQARLTPEEAAAIEAAAARRTVEADRPTPVRTAPLPAGGSIVSYNDFWNDHGARLVDDHRTSLIVDPPDGRVPPQRPGARRQIAADDDRATPDRPVRFLVGGIGTHGPEDRGLAERCLLGFNAGPPIVPVAPRGRYNQNMQLFQTPDHVVVFTEMVHEARIVPLDGRDPLPDGVRQWMGSSRGRWEGDTLVVETTNFTDKTASFGSVHAPRHRDRPDAALDRAVPARRRRHAPLRVHRRRPRDVHAAVHRVDSDAARDRPPLRVRVSRGKLRHAEPAVGRPRPGGALVGAWTPRSPRVVHARPQMSFRFSAAG